MIVRDLRRLALFAVPVVIFLYTGLVFYRNSAAIPSGVNRWIQPVLEPEPEPAKYKDKDQDQEKVDLPQEQEASSAFEHFGDISQDVPAAPAPVLDFSADNGFTSPDARTSHQEVFSTSTPDKKYFPIDFGETQGINPNIIPHPTLNSTWIVVAQQGRGADEQTIYFVELVCNAAFHDGVLRCLHPPTALPIAPSSGDKCEGDLTFFNFSVGPHDARVLYGPEKPYTVYGSNSQFTCFGQFIQDFRVLVDWDYDTADSPDFRKGTELQRPAPWGAVEKNWFPFWDHAGQMYVHYDVAPKRVFAQVNPDGSVGNDLAPFAAGTDEKCLAKYMPKLAPTLESIHQATNSLRITMCKRTDPGCFPTEANTFVFTIWQHKTFYNFHGVYEPYVMLFQQRAPFEVHAISKRPIWIHGREEHPDRGTSDMLYVTSMSWKSAWLTYHGYLDDELLLSFGIEDKRAGGIDLLAGDLLADLGVCSEI